MPVSAAVPVRRGGVPEGPGAARSRIRPSRGVSLRAVEEVARGRVVEGGGVGGDGMTSNGALMELTGVCVRFKTRAGVARAVDGVSLVWRKGEILGVVGESGSGKSTLARAMLSLVDLAAGEVTLDGASDGKAGTSELRRRVQMIFQDPYQTLNPRQRVSAIVTEPLKVQGVPAEEHDARV